MVQPKKKNKEERKKHEILLCKEQFRPLSLIYTHRYAHTYTYTHMERRRKRTITINNCYLYAIKLRLTLFSFSGVFLQRIYVNFKSAKYEGKNRT